MSSDALPPCGLYRTLKPVANVEAGRLVYFHNHGNPGPGLYLPESWAHNRAIFAPRGSTLPAGGVEAGTLLPLPVEGFYQVRTAFSCCAQQCVRFERDGFVQLGYNGAGRALVFVPELRAGSISVPERGTMIDDERLEHLQLLRVFERPATDAPLPRGIMIH